jgi:ubiquinone/menaquinone biosynthesis C-methylase UbiE
MSFIFPYLYDRHMARFEKACLKSWREELLKSVYGEVLEVGAGTGANVAHYTDQVTRLVLTEPDKHMRRFMKNKISGKNPDKVQVSDGTAEQISAEDESFDCVVAFLVLSGVSNIGTALKEIKRVLKPGGYLVFLDHAAAAEGTSARRWQNRIYAIWRMIGGCHVNLETEEAIIKAGFKMREITKERVRHALLTHSMRGIVEKT